MRGIADWYPIAFSLLPFTLGRGGSAFAFVATARFHADGLQAGGAEFGEVAERQFDGVVDALRRASGVQVIGDLVDVRADLSQLGENARDLLPVEAGGLQADMQEACADEGGDRMANVSGLALDCLSLLRREADRVDAGPLPGFTPHDSPPDCP